MFAPLEWFVRKYDIPVKERRIFRNSEWTTFLYVFPSRCRNLNVRELKRVLARSVTDPSYFQIQKVNGKLRVLIHISNGALKRFSFCLGRKFS